MVQVFDVCDKWLKMLVLNICDRVKKSPNKLSEKDYRFIKMKFKTVPVTNPRIAEVVDAGCLDSHETAGVAMCEKSEIHAAKSSFCLVASVSSGRSSN